MSKCQERNCNEEATEKFRNINLCGPHLIQIKYDMIPLALKTDNPIKTPQEE
jgi:hypothetical protein